MSWFKQDHFVAVINDEENVFVIKIRMQLMQTKQQSTSSTPFFIVKGTSVCDETPDIQVR